LIPFFNVFGIDLTIINIYHNIRIHRLGELSYKYHNWRDGIIEDEERKRRGILQENSAGEV